VPECILSREQRRNKLLAELEINPFLTDEELAAVFDVSVQTIRLDRLALGIPELRQRVRNIAQDGFGMVRSLVETELVGELLDLELGRSGLSVLVITPDMLLAKSKVARGHYLFAQANSLAVAVIDADEVLTGSARVRFKRPVYLHERVVAKATIKVRKGNTYLVSVRSRVGSELVFKGQFVVSVINSPKGEEA